jgi:Zn finger protein HypA/HybF involved in hydrogenase expression
MPPASIGVRPPIPGDKTFFVCKDCGHRFRLTPHIILIPVKCPECGGGNTAADTTIRY